MKNKQVIKDERGYRWFYHKSGKAEPVSWKMQAGILSIDPNRKEAKRGKKN